MTSILDYIIRLQNISSASVLLMFGVYLLGTFGLARLRLRRRRSNPPPPLRRDQLGRGSVLADSGSRRQEIRRGRKLVTAAVLTIGAIPTAINLFEPVRFDYGWKPLKIVRAATPGNAKALVLIHGWTGSEATWAQFVLLAAADPHLAGRALFVVNYPTFISRRGLTVAQIADSISRDIQTSAPDYDIAIISHSLGGLVTRRLLTYTALTRPSYRITRTSTLGTPFAGADLAGLAAFFRISPSVLPDLRPGSSFLTAMDLDWRAYQHHSQRATQMCFASPDDGVVDQASAIHLCDDFRYLPQWGHTELTAPDARTDPRYAWPVQFILAGE